MLTTEALFRISKEVGTSASRVEATVSLLEGDERNRGSAFEQRHRRFNARYGCANFLADTEKGLGGQHDERNGLFHKRRRDWQGYFAVVIPYFAPSSSTHFAKFEFSLLKRADCGDSASKSDRPERSSSVTWAYCFCSTSRS